MKKLFKKIPTKIFTLLSILFCFLGDVVFVFFIYHKLQDLRIIKATLMIESEIIGADSIVLTDPTFLHELSLLSLQVIITVMLLFLLFHLLVYLMFFYGKKIANEYILLLSWCAMLVCFIISPFEFRHSMIFSFVLFIQALLYCFVALGFILLEIPKFSRFKKEEL